MNLKVMQLEIYITDDLTPGMAIKYDEDFKELLFCTENEYDDFTKRLRMAFISSIALGLCEPWKIEIEEFKNYFLKTTEESPFITSEEGIQK